MNNQTSIIKCINVSSRQFKIWMANELKDLHIGISEYFFLTNMPKQGSITTKKLCCIIHYDQALGTRTINNLVKKGFMTKTPNEKDKREILISLTPEGAELSIKIKKIIMGYIDTLKAEFTDEEFELLERLLFKVYTKALDLNKEVD